MLIEQLKADYRLLVRVLTAERRMREAVLRGSPKQAEKLAEMDGALQALLRIKEMLKVQLQIDPEEAEAVQAPLLALPVERQEYR